MLETVQAAVAAAGDLAADAFVRGRDRPAQVTEVLGQVLTQTRPVLAGTTHVPDRVVSVVDPTARPIVKGKVGKPVEFGYKAALDEVDDGFVVGRSPTGAPPGGGPPRIQVDAPTAAAIPGIAPTVGPD